VVSFAHVWLKTTTRRIDKLQSGKGLAVGDIIALFCMGVPFCSVEVTLPGGFDGAEGTPTSGLFSPPSWCNQPPVPLGLVLARSKFRACSHFHDWLFSTTTNPSIRIAPDQHWNLCDSKPDVTLAPSPGAKHLRLEP
jgi:hypothetical protein